MGPVTLPRPRRPAKVGRPPLNHRSGDCPHFAQPRSGRAILNGSSPTRSLTISATRLSVLSVATADTDGFASDAADAISGCLWLGAEGHVAGVHVDGFRTDAFGHEALPLRLVRAVTCRDEKVGRDVLPRSLQHGSGKGGRVLRVFRRPLPASHRRKFPCVPCLPWALDISAGLSPPHRFLPPETQLLHRPIRGPAPSVKTRKLSSSVRLLNCRLPSTNFRRSRSTATTRF